MRAVIVGGAPIGDYEQIKKLLSPDDFYVFCDSGLYHKDGLSVTPDLIVGDFDSHKKPQTDIETIVLPREKDDTDTVFAAKECLKRGFADFLIVGAVGGRLDHSLGNMYLLLYLERAGADAVLADDYSEMCIVSQKEVLIDKSYPFFSVLNIDGSARGINISGAKFNLTDGQIEPEYQYGISNEVESDFAKVSIKEGKALLIKVKRY